jgi:hypothetical protein
MDNEQKANATGPMSTPYTVCCLHYSPLVKINDLWGGVPLEEVSCHRKGKRDTLLGTWNVRSLYRPEGKRPLGRPRRRWEDNIRMDLQEVGLGYEDWIGLAQDRDRWRALVSAVRNLRVP